MVENYFYYYKIHTIVGICVLLVGGYLIYSDATATKYDLQIDYISELGSMTLQTDMLADIAEGHIDDVTGNEVCDAFVMLLDMAPSQDMQYAQAMQVKYMTEVGYSEGFVFIVTEKYKSELAESGVFENAADWSGTDVDGEFISLAGCKVLAELGMPDDQLYVAVRKLRDKENDKEKKIAEHENGIKFAKFLINER